MDEVGKGKEGQKGIHSEVIIRACQRRKDLNLRMGSDTRE